MPHAGRQLLAAVRELRRSIAGEASGHVERWQREIEQPSFAASVSNFAHYLAFRHHDLREVQRDLMRYGLSSLGRLESRVMINTRYGGDGIGRPDVRHDRAPGLATLK
jgi:pyruvate kinase